MANYQYYVDENGKITRKKKEEKTSRYEVGEGGKVFFYEGEDDIAPVKTTTTATRLVGVKSDTAQKKDEGKLSFFQKSGVFDDGYNFGDVTKTILGTAGDAGVTIVKGAQRLVEGVVDAGAYGVAGVGEAFGADKFAKRLKEAAEESQTDATWGGASDWLDEYSVLGRTSEAVMEGIGQVGTIILTGGLASGPAAATALTTGLTGVSGFGSGMSEAYKNDATDEEAVKYGLIAGGSEALTELMFGGLGKAVGATGLSKGVFSADDLLAKKVSNLFSNQIAKNITEFGIKASAEGIEEVIAGTAQAIGKWQTYKSEEELADIIKDENLLEQFVVGAVTSGIAQSGIVPGMKNGSLIEANKTGKDFITGFTQDEQAVIDKEVERRIADQEKDGIKLTNKQKGDIQKQVESDIDEGGISIDTIEEALGGDTYKAYQDTISQQEALQNEFDTLNKMKQGEMTGEQVDRRTELKEQLAELKNNSKAGEIRKRLSDEVFTKAQNTRLVESYNERTRRSEAFQADMSQYDTKQQETIQRAVDSGILNNTRKTHKFVDMIAKISADKGVSFDFTNNAKLKESGFAVDGKQVNGYVTANGVTVNINSNKALNTVVGHEITHILEGTELYTELQNAVKQYAESKGDYQGRVDAITKLYNGMDADIDAEVTADLVGDYLFTDPDFIQRLSVEHRNVFQKVYDEIKYLAKIATAGSKEARQLEKAKKAFEDAYRAEGKGVSGTDVRYSLSSAESARRESPIISKLTGREITDSTYETLAKLESGEKVDLSEIESLTEVEEGKQQLAVATSNFIASHPELKDVPARDVGTHLLNSAERERLRNDILAQRLQEGSFTHIDNDGKDVYNGSVEKGRRLDIVIGLPAAGKSTAIVNPLSQYYKSAVIDSDIIKGMLPEYDGGWGASLVHEESSDINARLFTEELRIGNNVVLPIVGGKTSSVERYVALAKARGYSVHLHLNELSSSKALGRNLRRYFNTGRFINPAIAGKYGDAPTQVYEEMKARSDIDGYSRWSNDVQKGQRPTNVEHSGDYGLYVEYSGAWRASRGTGADRSAGGSPQGESGSIENSGNGVAGLQGYLGESDSTRGFPDGGSGLSEILRLNPKTQEAIAKSGVVSFELVDSTNDSGAFSNALNAARNADAKNGWAVTPKSAEELVEEGVHTIMSTDGKAGLGVTPDGDIVAVFKNQDGGPRGALDTLIPAALEKGGKKLDCYGPGLVDLYSRYGFIPVARVTFNPEYANDGWTPDKGEPDIFFMVHNGDGPDTVIANKGKYKQYTDAELESLPLFGKDDYGDAYAYRDEMIPQDIAPVRNSLSNEGDIAPAYGTYNVYGKDVALEDVPIRDDLAPVQDTVQDTVQESDFAPTTEAEANALADETLPTFTDEDAPPTPETEYDDFTDTTALDPKALKDISKALKDVLYLNSKEVKAIADVVQKYSTTEFPDKADLFDELQAKFGTKETVERNEETAAIKKTLREYPINVSQAIKKDITDYGAFMRRNFGKVRFSKEGVPVDSAYQDLSSMFPGYFPADITNASDQLMRIAEVAGMEINETETFELSDSDIMEAVDVIEAEVGKYKEAQVQAAAEADRQAAFAQIDDIAPVVERETVDIPAPADTSKPIKTVKERLSAKLQNYQTELATNQQQRMDSQASYEEEISRLYAEYSGKKNKNTKAANDILRRIDRLQTMKGNVDADYAKRISDLEAKVEQIAEEVRTGESATEQAAMRQEVHAGIVDNIKTTFGERGFDFDEVLENAKDLSTFATVDNTPQRVLEKALGYKEGQILSDLTVNKVAQNETEGIKWLNSYTDRKSGLLAKISKRYNIKPGSKESAAAQMYAEGFYVNKDNDIVEYGDAELAKDFPNVNVQARIKGLAHDPIIRQIYDDTLAAINESRARNAYPEIQRLDNYFLHFRAQTDTFSRLGIPFNPKDIKAKDLPTDLNGVTADLKPGQPYFASAMHRKGKRTSFDLLGGLEQYLTSAKDQIYHIDDIQTLRALRNYIADNYGQAKGLDNLDALTEEEADAKIKEVFDGHLSTLAKFLNEEANVIAGKTSLTDRGLEGVIGRRGITFLSDLNKQVGANMVGFNVSSSLTNLVAAVQGFAKTNKFDFVKAMAQTTANKFKSIGGKSDGFAEQSPVMVRRKGADRYHRTAWQKASDAGYFLMSAVDNVSTELIARAKYNELTRKGMDSQQAHQETDKWVSRLMGDRSLGQQPQLYNSKMLGMLTKFQLEVRNQLDSQFYDTIKEAEVETEHIESALKRNSKKAAKITSVFFQLAVAQHLFGKAFESIAGYNPAFDIIDVLSKLFGWDDEEDDDDTALDNIQEGFLALLGDLPYTSTFTGGRIPISSALPIEQLVTGKDQYGNEKSRWETVKETAPYYFLPGGYGQIKKTTQGLGMFDDDLPTAGSYTDSGNLRFPVEDTMGNRVQAALFGQWASENARDYFDNERKPLKEKQIEEYIDLDLPISEYWDYREGLAKQDTLEEKLDYIDSLDLPISKKNIMANNVTDRKNPIDLTGYADFGSLEEFDFATKNPEKYAFFEQSGITYAAYANGDEDAKRAYNWAYENPEKYTVSRAIASDVVEYRRYTSELNDLTADKDEDGKSISGSRKEKVIDYINRMDADYGAKIILFRSQYTSDDTYNSEIVEYLNSREDITYGEMVTILEELDFTVYPDGTVVW